MVKKLRKNAKDISQKGSANGKGTKKNRPVAGPVLFAGTVFEATYVVLKTDRLSRCLPYRKNCLQKIKSVI